MSKTTKSIIIAASVIIVLIVGTIVISNIDTSKDNNVDTTDDLYSIYSADTTDILSVKAESENGTITVKSIGDSEWSVNDMDASEIDSSKAGALVGTISTLSSKNKIEENPVDLSQYGLDNPQVTVTVEKKNGQIDKMIIGDLSPTLGEYFVMKDGDNTVYTMYDFKVDTLKKPISYYKEFNRFNINIDNINDIKIVRSDETIEIRILSNINNNTNNVWEMVQPYQSGANDDYIDNKILAPIEEISLTTPIENADGGFSEKSPVLMITVKPYDNSTGKYGEEYTETLTIGRTEGDMTYVKYKEQVFKVSSDIISFANDSSYNIVSKLQALVDISEVKSVTVEYNVAEHTIDITHNDSDMTFVLDGQKVDTKITQAIYKSIVGLAVDGVYKDETLGDTVMKIKYKGIKSSSDTEIDFKSIDDLSCALIRNGKTEFTIKKSKLNEFMDLFNTYVENPEKQGD